MRRGLWITVVCALALALPAVAQMRGGFGGRGFSGGHGGFHGGGFRGGVVIGNRGFISRPLRHQGFITPGVPLIYPYSPFWDEPEEYVEQPAPQPPPQPIVIVVDRDRPETPAAPAQPPLIIEREGDHYVQRGSAEPRDVTPAPARRASAPPEPLPPPALVVLRNGKRLQVTDYALTTDTLYDLSGGRTHRIALSEIDLAATEKANQDRGINFSLPRACDKSDPGCAQVNVY